MTTLTFTLDTNTDATTMTSPFSTDVIDTDVTGVTSQAWDVTVGCGGDGVDGSLGCNVTQALRARGLCYRLAPPPVPPWLKENPSKLRELTGRCKSLTLYQELCQPELRNITWDYASPQETTDGDVLEKGSPAAHWVIPVLAVVVVLLLMVLVVVVRKYYGRPRKKSMYRVSGAGYRFKPPHGTSSSWTGGPLVESETAESFLSQSASVASSGLHYARSPVSRLLEQTQYVATPTEDEHRPRPSGPPSFASPAYFLPSLSWLRLPALRQAWPVNMTGSPRGVALYDAARPVQCLCGQTTHHWSAPGATTHHWPVQGDMTHHWPADRERTHWGVPIDNQSDSRTDNEHEYSEICEGPPIYSSLGSTSCVAGQGIGPYEYDLQENTHRCPGCDDCVATCPHHIHAGGNPHLPTHHRYEKLWQFNQDHDTCLTPEEDCSIIGSCENGWLSRYRLPNPSVPLPEHVQDIDAGHAYRPNLSNHISRGEINPAHGHARVNGLNLQREESSNHISRGDINPAHGQARTNGQNPHRADSFNHVRRAEISPTHTIDGQVNGLNSHPGERPQSSPACAWVRTGEGSRSEVKYVNPVYEGQQKGAGSGAGPENHRDSGSSPLLSRLWGYMGISTRS